MAGCAPASLTRNVAASPDGTHVAVASYLPARWLLLDVRPRPGSRSIPKPVGPRDGKKRARGCRRGATALSPAPVLHRRAQGRPARVWEISFRQGGRGRIPVSHIHDHAAQRGSLIPRRYLNPRRAITRRGARRPDFFTQGPALRGGVGASRRGPGQVVEPRRCHAEVSQPAAATACRTWAPASPWEWQGPPPPARAPEAAHGDGERQPQAGEVTVIDMKTWGGRQAHSPPRPRLLPAQPLPAAATPSSRFDGEPGAKLYILPGRMSTGTRARWCKEITEQAGETLRPRQVHRDGPPCAPASLWEDERAR